MSVDITGSGSTLFVGCERVRRGWGFTRRGSRTRHVIYRVERWGRTDVTISRDADYRATRSYRHDFDGFKVKSGSGYNRFVLSHADFAEFVRKYYGASMQVATDARAEQRALEQRRRIQQTRDSDHEQIAAVLDSIRDALDSEKGIYAIVDMLDASRKEGYDEACEYTYDYEE